MTKLSQKNTILGSFWAHFCPNFSKNEFLWEKGLCQFFNISIIYDHAKYQKKVINDSREKFGTDSWTDRWMDRQTIMIL